ncbi:HlyD family secretion protein [Paenibacillus thailandensis]|uniref:HlyD family secretion protein n=1 Tax=Paenibacillus thailandensis TaxID=393250 RepID=A0ABW5QSU2_9BACL
MKWQRSVVYIVFAALIACGVVLLNTNQAFTQSADNRNHPTASIEAEQYSASFKVGGRIASLLVEEGSAVKKGDVLATLQSDELQAKVDQAEAALSGIEGQIEQAEAAVSAAEAKKGQGEDAVGLTKETVEKQIAQAEAAVEAAEAQVSALKSGARPEEKKQAEIQRDAAKEAFEIAENSYNQLQGLLKEGLVSQTEVDKAKLSYLDAKAKYEAAEQQYKLVQEGARQEEIEAAEAQVAQAKAALALAQANRQQVAIKEGDVAAADAAVTQAEGALSAAKAGKAQAEAAKKEAETYLGYTKLVATADGVVLSRSAELGEIVGAGYPVFTIEKSAAKKTAKFFLPETEIAGLKVGDEVTVKVSSTGEMAKAQVKTIAKAASYATQKASQNQGDLDIVSFGVKVEFLELPETAIAGMTVEWYGTAESGE